MTGRPGKGVGWWVAATTLLLVGTAGLWALSQLLHELSLRQIIHLAY